VKKRKKKNIRFQYLVSQDCHCYNCISAVTFLKK